MKLRIITILAVLHLIIAFATFGHAHVTYHCNKPPDSFLCGEDYRFSRAFLIGMFWPFYLNIKLWEAYYDHPQTEA